MLCGSDSIPVGCSQNTVKSEPSATVQVVAETFKDHSPEVFVRADKNLAVVLVRVGASLVTDA